MKNLVLIINLIVYIISIALIATCVNSTESNPELSSTLQQQQQNEPEPRLKSFNQVKSQRARLKAKKAKTTSTTSTTTTTTTTTTSTAAPETSEQEQQEGPLERPVSEKESEAGAREEEPEGHEKGTTKQQSNENEEPVGREELNKEEMREKNDESNGGVSESASASGDEQNVTTGKAKTGSRHKSGNKGSGKNEKEESSSTSTEDEEEKNTTSKETGSKESGNTKERSQAKGERRFTQKVNGPKTQITNWGTYLALPIIAVAVIGVILILLRKLWQRYKGREGRGSSAGLGGFADLKNIQILGQQYKEKVQPDNEQLAANMELNEEAGDKDDSKKDEDKLGRLQFRLDYDFNNTNLAVGVLQAEDLPGMDMCGTSDPYVKVYLMPDKKKKFETKVHRKTLNPVFNETFNFKVPYAEVTTRTLVFAVYDFDR